MATFRLLVSKVWSVPLFLLVASILAALVESGSPASLAYQRGAVLEGEIWRALTAHFVHFGYLHLALNVSMISLVFLIFGGLRGLREWFLIMFLCCLGISATFLVLEPDVQWYLGLSGVAHGLTVAGATFSVLKREAVGSVVFAGVLLKLLAENAKPGALHAAAFLGGPVLEVAHLYGAMWGLAGAVSVHVCWRRLQPTHDAFS